MGSKGRTATQPDAETGPQRRCLVTRESADKEVLLRFVLSPDAEIVFDAAATLPGRGMWLSARADVINTAVKRGVFARAARQQVKTSPNLREFVEAALLRRITELLGLARRSNNAISGFEKAREMVTANKAGLIVQASDGSAEERARFVGGKKIPVVAVLNAEALGHLFGRERVVHVAIAAGRLARMIEIDAARLAGVAGGVTSGHWKPPAPTGAEP